MWIVRPDENTLLLLFWDEGFRVQTLAKHLTAECIEAMILVKEVTWYDSSLRWTFLFGPVDSLQPRWSGSINMVINSHASLLPF